MRIDTDGVLGRHRENKDWPYQKISFHLKSDLQHRSERISVTGNAKEDYQLHFEFVENHPGRADAVLWLISDNRDGEFAVPVRFY